jgi:hypothetical protein
MRINPGNNFFKFVTISGAVIFLITLMSPTFLQADQPVKPRFKEEIIIAPEETQDNVVAFGSRVVVEGKVKENVVVFGGEIILSGEVGKSVFGLGSKVVIKSTAVIEEDLVVIGGIMEKEAGCQVGKDTVYIPTSGKLVGEIFRKGIFFPLGTLFLALKLISLFFGIFLTMFVAGFFPRQISFAASKIRLEFWLVFGTGLLAMVIYVGLIILSALLMFLIIGIPFFFLFLFAGIVLKIFGGTVVSYFFGESFLRAVGVKKLPQVIWTAVLGLVIVFLLGLFPILGFIFSVVISLIGWGVTIRTRFGTLDNWFIRNNV